MKNFESIKKNSWLSIVFIMLISISNAQTVFKHTATKSNTSKHITSINHNDTNGKKDKILIITHDYGSSGPYVTKAVGVWYNGKKWTIFNQDKSTLKAATKFNVLATNKSANAFVFTNPRLGGSAKINNSKLNNKPNAKFLITQNWGKSGPYNASPVGIMYSNGFWHVFNTDGKPMPKGAKFNILINNDIFKHALSKSPKSHITSLNNSKTNAKPNNLVFATFNSQGSKKNFNNPIGVWYSRNKWTVYNENRKLLKGNEAYNILSMKPIGGLLFYKPVLIRTTKPIVVGGNTPSTGNTERQGQDLTKYEDIVTILDGENYESFIEKLNVFRKLYKDKNTKSNVYYYFPAEYTLKWDKESNEYAFNVYYMSSDEGTGSVLINAELTPQVNSEDVKLAEKLLGRKLGKQVKLMPMELRDIPKVDFGATLTNFNVKPESINASIPSDYHKPITIDWRMDSDVDNFVGAMLNNIGVNLNLEFKPFGDETTIISVPINLEVNSPVTFGKIVFEQKSELLNGWTNSLDYPIIPKKLIMLRKQGNRNFFETVQLTASEIPVGSSFSLDSNAKKKLSAATNLLSYWLDYSLNNNCNDCNLKVKKKIIGGTSGSQVSNIGVQVLNALAYSEAHSIRLSIKSIQGDPNGINEITFPAITLSEDGEALDGVKLYIPEDSAISYDYQLKLIMNNGEEQTSKWVNNSSELLIIGESQIKKAFDINEQSELEKAKDSIIGDKKEDLIEKGIDILGGLFGKKKEKETTPDEPEEDPNPDD